MTYTICLRSSV